MNRELYAGGGILSLTPRSKFGLGSKIKRAVRKIIPNEVSSIAVKAAPFVAPFNPALAGAMSGLGTFDQTGSISAGVKSGLINYGLGQAGRYIGGAGFQGNPFAAGGAFTPSGFMSGFSSPFGTQTGIGKLLSDKGFIGTKTPFALEVAKKAITVSKYFGRYIATRSRGVRPIVFKPRAIFSIYWASSA